MEQKNIKIVLFLTILFSTEFANAQDAVKNQDIDYQDIDYQDIYAQNIRTGSCTEQQFQQTTQCSTQVQNNLIQSTVSNNCIFFGILGSICIEPLRECYTTQELNRYKELLIQSTVEVLISKDYAAKIEDCPEYKDFASKGLVAGNNMGIMIALIIAVAYFGF